MENYQILLIKISRRFLVTTKLVKVINAPAIAGKMNYSSCPVCCSNSVPSHHPMFFFLRS